MPEPVDKGKQTIRYGEISLQSVKLSSDKFLLSMAAFKLPMKSWVISTETMGFTEPEIFTI